MDSTQAGEATAVRASDQNACHCSRPNNLALELCFELVERVLASGTHG
jgi:hypothetical protein